ncbi:MAG: tetratricopeptide repeat protein [Chloroflexota bacterium]
MEDITKQQAMILFEQGFRQQMRGNLTEAIDLYKRSLGMQETAEAHTFLGWTYSMLNRYRDAIAACKKAIEVDPDYGNPYNDIGSYLIELEEIDEALEWLEKATLATRYDNPQFPYVNMARAHEKQGRYLSALDAYEKALDIAPLDRVALHSKYSLIARLN